jgi:FKBP-type peptidyl-prolyl cis-trans isomerase
MKRLVALAIVCGALACSGAALAGEPALRVKDLLVGKGRGAKAGDTLIVQYIGRLSSGKEFDNTRKKVAAFRFVLGEGKYVVRGWDLGLPGMKAGGKRRLTLPPSLAYGPAGVPGRVPPKATVIFDIELVRIHSGPAPARK